jgi:2-oxoglutarate ferredoxin oxidoreductase subunit alpha
MKGNEALALAAIKGGCSHFFGYPITPQNEIPEYLARELPKSGGVFLQAESETAAIHMVYGAAAAGGRVMTTSSSPGIALMQEGISMLAGAELPCVIVNVQRGGPGIGGIQPSQSDYFQMTRGGGNGDYRVLSFAPATLQESVELVIEAFELADKYRTPVFIVSDGMLGQMMEPVEFKGKRRRKPKTKNWAAVGHGGKRAANIVKTLFLQPEKLEEHNRRLQEKYRRIEANEVRCESLNLEDAEVVITAHGSCSRIVKNAIEILAELGISTGMIRPLTLWPFGSTAFEQIPRSCRAVLCVEMSCGQMVEDVRLALGGRLPVVFYGRTGGVVPAPAEIVEQVRMLVGR